MKKTKIERRLENALNAFFADENSGENSLSFTGESALLKQETTKNLADKLDVFVKALKQVFLFFPGTFVLFNLSLVLTVFVLNPPPLPNLPYSGRLAFALLVSAFMTMFGLGDVRRPRHLVIPASIVVFGFVSGAFTALVSGGLRFIDSYAIYLFPLALIIPILAKGLVDKTWGEDS